LTRAYILPALPDPVFSIGSLVISKPLLIMLVFAVLMVAASVSMIRTKKIETKKIEFSASSKFLLIGLEGFVVGTVTGFVGAGGGFLIIPALVILVGMPMKLAVGTSLFIIAAKSLIGFTGDLQQHPVIDWPLITTITGIAIVGLFVGLYFSKIVSEQALKKGFGYFVLIMGIFILFDQIQKTTI
ncbi:MAG: sulfite exporter TauE/SafE family protein, partial [Pseudobdellovibrionaceae bacterium]